MNNRVSLFFRECWEEAESNYRVFSFLAALVGSAWWKLRGLQVFVFAEEQTIREAICRPCEFYRDGVCQQCGCFVFAKTWLAREKCPEGKWLRIERTKKDSK